MHELEHAQHGHLEQPGQPRDIDRASFLAVAFLAGYTGRTRETYSTDLRQWGTWCLEHDVGVLAATRADIQVFTGQLQQAGRAPSTIGRKLSAIGGFYRYAVIEGDLDRNPAEHVRRPKVSSDSSRSGLDLAELLRLVDVARAAGPVPHALVLLLALNGLRVSEACGARREDLGHDQGHVLVEVTRKGGRRARIVLADPTAAALDALPQHPGPLLELSRYAAWRVIHRLVDAAGITKTISPHSLRHTFITLALDAGAALRDVQDAAGHTDPRTTRRYDRNAHNLDRHPTYAVAALLDPR